jgi:GNAT superfamily N-acetyltransferase
MKIRRGTHTDIPELLPLCKEFYEQSKYSQSGIKFSSQAITTLLTTVLGDSGIVAVAEDEGHIVGFILVAVFPFHFNPKHKVATEIIFYVTARGRGTGVGTQLLKKAEQVAKQRGVKLFSMVSHESVNSSAAHSLYEKLGYERSEVAYIKEL